MEISNIPIPIDEIVKQLPTVAFEIWKHMISGAGGFPLRLVGWAIIIIPVLISLWLVWKLLLFFNKTWDKSEYWIRKKLK